MKHHIEIIEDFTFHVFIYEKADKDLLNEAKTKGTPLTGTYSYRKDQPHSSTGEYHIHVYDDKKEIFSINKSGTGHDGNHGIRIPNKVFTALKDKFPKWDFPEDQIIESLEYLTVLDSRKQFLRPVLVFQYRADPTTNVDSYNGWFHTYADDPILTGAGYIAKTVAIIEDENGYIHKVPIDKIKFLDAK